MEYVPGSAQDEYSRSRHRCFYGGSHGTPIPGRRSRRPSGGLPAGSSVPGVVTRRFSIGREDLIREEGEGSAILKCPRRGALSPQKTEAVISSQIAASNILLFGSVVFMRSAIASANLSKGFFLC